MCIQRYTPVCPHTYIHAVSGVNARVYRGTYGAAPAAIKVYLAPFFVPLSRAAHAQELVVTSESKSVNFQREVAILTKLRHLNIVRPARPACVPIKHRMPASALTYTANPATSCLAFMLEHLHVRSHFSATACIFRTTTSSRNCTIS